MPQRALASRHSIDSCTFQLHTWKPFNLTSTTGKPNPKTLDSDSYNSNPKSFRTLHNKRPCLADRATSFSASIDSIDLSKLSIFDDDKPLATRHKRDKFHWVARKRRRRGSRSLSGMSSDRSGTRNGRCCSVGATATCSDFMVAAGGTDSSGELFGNGGDVNWSSDVSEAKNSRRDRAEGVIGEKQHPGSGFGLDAQWGDSGYGSEPGYRGDAEFGYGDELDEEEEDAKLLLWGERFGDANLEMSGENTFSEQKTHHRGRRRKNDWKTVDCHT
ncbi:hypothetical protein Nepgr_004459 [Nepenthes gracilis]|uniref:Uncharacterized protein n=1 Tax=Nepenthes gracilis TaxID=150966 RepID=A0AAD3S1F1_NEPGR|nr:hypothetical protein Nepgr_004459 [Nepenthes gracilis]